MHLLCSGDVFRYLWLSTVLCVCQWNGRQLRRFNQLRELFRRLLRRRYWRDGVHFLCEWDVLRHDGRIDLLPVRRWEVIWCRLLNLLLLLWWHLRIRHRCDNMH